jgi:hypothetical protein
MVSATVSDTVNPCKILAAVNIQFVRRMIIEKHDITRASMLLTVTNKQSVQMLGSFLANELCPV